MLHKQSSSAAVAASSNPWPNPARVLTARTRHALARLAWPHGACWGSSILDKVRRILSGIGR